MTGRRPERAGRGGGLELVLPSAADETERIARALIDASPGLTAAQKQIEQDHLTRHLAAGQAGQRTLDGYAEFLGPLRALGRNGGFGGVWDGDTLPIPAPVVLAYLYAREGEITHVTAGSIVRAVMWVHRNGTWPDAEHGAPALDTGGGENPADNPAIKAHLASRADGENRPDRTRCLALTIAKKRINVRCRADSTGLRRCAKTTANPDGLCVKHRTAEPVYPAELAAELRRCRNFTIRGESLCHAHVDHERCRADLDGWTGSDGTARCPNPAAPPVLCDDHQHHPAKGSPTLDRRCQAADLDAPCPNQAVATHLCWMHQEADLIYPESQAGVLADEPVILPGPTKKALAIRLPDLEAGCAYDPEPERLAQLAAVRDTLAPHRVEMWQMADLGPDDLTFTDDGTVTIQFQVSTTRPTGSMCRFPQLDDAEWLTGRYVDKGATQDEIAAELGCTAPTVFAALRRHGIAARPAGAGRRPELDDAEWLTSRYVDKGATQDEIAAELDCTAPTVWKALTRHGIIEARPAGQRQFPLLDDAEWLARRYVDEGATQRQIAADAGCSRLAVQLAMARHGIEARPSGPRLLFPLLDDAEWLARRYVDEGATQRQIAAGAGCSKAAVRHALVRHGIEAPFRTVVLVASGGADCPVVAIRAVLDNPHHPDPNRPFTHGYGSAADLPGPYSAWVEARDSSILPVGFWLGRRGGELGQTQLAQLAVREIDGQRRVMFTVNPKHSKTGDSRELVLPPCTCAAEIITREPMSLTPEMQALIADQGDDPDGCRLERLVPKIAHRPALCVVCSLARWLAVRWDRPGPTVRCHDGGCGDAAVDWIDAFLRSLPKGDRRHRIWPPLRVQGEWQNPDPFRSLDAQAISNIVRRRLERAGFAPSSSHGLKRGAVTGMTEAGMDLAEISEITGNEDLKVLEGYIADDVAEKKRIEAGQRSLGVLWLPDDQDAFTVGGDTAITA